MTFSGSGSTIRYPDLNCAGSLRPSGFDGNARVYIEEITKGGCDNGGRWEVTVLSDVSLDATYSPPSGKYIVVGSFLR